MSSSRVFEAIGKDDAYFELKSRLYDDFNSEDSEGKAYSHVLNGVIDVLKRADSIDHNVDINSECKILIEDVATSGLCRYPWEVVKLLLLVIWGHVFDEVREYENANNEEEDDFERYEHEKRESLARLLEFDLPPFTLQRLCEIPLNQPYRALHKIFNAYRKLFNVRNIEYEPVCIPKFVKLEDFKLNKVYSNLDKWDEQLETSFRPQWSQDIWIDCSSDDSSSDYLEKRSIDE
ncbi:hypothetical protein BEWA_023960 [Theileria equi strain WA]|uniref:Uncharacterized protein n=1 Tax=Theileria equi strain WA TaxID=1537102 RepID=L0AVA9_THEEQ|nr:hypothetical protein BEWA_023960 [Theileria equi strain WA]AFZ79547.1 hypothetical protein BEWA_023960 [Theileria equi strain WA]|eukprot:XP_004829213.1 hypothetical protein BEWA_023960 [Theileria equi strain WA]